MLVITSCSSTKSAPAPAALMASSYRTGSLATFARRWVRQAQAETERRPAGTLYGGAGAAAAAKAVQVLGCRLCFVSAGMSLVSSTTRIPSYDLTVSSRSTSMPPPMRTGLASAADWWSALNEAMGVKNPFARLLGTVDGLVLLALPRAYLQMVEQDLLALSEPQLKRLRIITVGEVKVPPRLLDQVIAYDERVDQLPEVPGGTKASIVQRALLDFSQRLAKHRTTTSIVRQRHWVSDALDALPHKGSTPARKGVTDERVARWILRTDPKRTQSATRLLRTFRAEGFACEQGRFARIAHSTSTAT